MTSKLTSKENVAVCTLAMLMIIDNPVVMC